MIMSSPHTMCDRNERMQEMKPSRHTLIKYYSKQEINASEQIIKTHHKRSVRFATSQKLMVSVFEPFSHRRRRRRTFVVILQIINETTLNACMICLNRIIW